MSAALVRRKLGAMTTTRTKPKTTGELYVRAMEATRRILNEVPVDRWHAPTPCTEWDARQVANHIIGENLWAAELFHGRTIEQVGNALDGDLTGDDIARGTGGNTRLDPELVAACQPIAQELTRQFRQAGVFGDDLPVDADADPQTRLLALLGRSA